MHYPAVSTLILIDSPTKSIMKLLLLITFFSLDTLPSDSLLFASLTEFHNLQTQAQLSEHQATQKNRWLKYIPTIGLTYTLNGQPRPTLSWSSNLIHNSQQDKIKRQAKQTSILQQHQLNLQKKQLQLQALLQQYQFLQEDIVHETQILHFDRQLFQVKEEQAKHLEISPTELVQATKSFRQKEYQLLKKQRALQSLKTKILIHAHFYFMPPNDLGKIE